MSKTVIRIEHTQNGVGLFRCRINDNNVLMQHSNYQQIMDRHSNRDKFPAYQSDDFLYHHIDWENIENYHFSFKSLEQLNEALTNEELKECINALGFKVYMLDVTDYFESPFQIVYKKESITAMKDISFMFL